MSTINARPPIWIVYPNTVPAFRKCEVCDGTGSKVIGASTVELAMENGIKTTLHLGAKAFCGCCRGDGAFTRYLTRGKALTPLVAH